DALPFKGYVDLFEEIGFKLIDSTLHGDLLRDMIGKVRNRVNLGGAALPEDDEYLADKQDDVLRILDLIEKQVDTGNLSYDVFVFKKP
ncbi:MAG: hypothetical protein ACW985_04775, partial [Candidatus Thorarchaeota archaeon]